MKIIKKFPYYRQKTANTCGPATIRMIFRFFDIIEDEEKLSKELKTNEDIGTSHIALITLARKKGFYCYVNDDSTLNEIKHFIDLGLPVLVNYIEPDADEGHYAVVIGYNNKYLFLNDPWNGKKFKLLQKEFKKRWYSQYSNARKWLLVISNHNFNFGRIYHPFKLRRFFSR